MSTPDNPVIVNARKRRPKKPRALLDELLDRGEDLEPRTNEFMPHRPHSGAQSLFLSPLVTPIREVFYGGAAGGGKTDALLMAALQYVDVPGYSAVIVRRTYPMLNQSKGLIERSLDWLRGKAEYNQGNHRWTFPTGATITFRHLSDERALSDYQGAEFQFIGVDEVTDLSEREYRFLFSRLRATSEIDVPFRVRSASNPTGPGREWVHQRFVLPGPSSGRLFIPARLEDNPSLDRGEYERSLIELGSLEYQRLRYGDWDVKSEGRIFKRAWFEVVVPSEVPTDVRHARYWDLAATETPKGREARRLSDPDYTAGLLLARASSGVYYVDDVARFRKSPGGVEVEIRRTAEQDGRDVPIFIEQEPGSSGKALIVHYRRTVLDGFNVRGVPSTASKELRAAPVAARAEAGEVKLVAGPWVDAFLDELAEFPIAPHDDQVDALSGAYAALSGGPSLTGVKPSGLKITSHWRDR